MDKCNCGAPGSQSRWIVDNIVKAIGFNLNIEVLNFKLRTQNVSI